MPIQRGVFTRGGTPWRYLKPLAANLFLSANEADVRSALEAGVPAARVYPHSARASDAPSRGSADRLRRRRRPLLRRSRARLPVERPRRLPGARARAGRDAARRRPVPAAAARAASAAERARARHAHPHRAGHRAQRAGARAGDPHADGMEGRDRRGDVPRRPAKGEFLREFEPDFFFDDQTGHIENASAHVPSGHVASGISNPRRR